MCIGYIWGGNMTKFVDAKCPSILLPTDKKHDYNLISISK
jgi:hypothetical protein